MLVDTSVWVDHLRRGDRALAALLEDGAVEIHPFVIGELALGGLRADDEVRRLLAALPAAPMARHEEVLYLVAEHGLAGSGIGWVDAHLLASSLLGGIELWSRDRRLQAAARDLGVAPRADRGRRG